MSNWESRPTSLCRRFQHRGRFPGLPQGWSRTLNPDGSCLFPRAPCRARGSSQENLTSTLSQTPIKLHADRGSLKWCHEIHILPQRSFSPRHTTLLNQEKMPDRSQLRARDNIWPGCPADCPSHKNQEKSRRPSQARRALVETWGLKHGNPPGSWTEKRQEIKTKEAWGSVGLWLMFTSTQYWLISSDKWHHTRVRCWWQGRKGNSVLALQ